MASRLKHRQATENRLFALSHPLRAALFHILTERTASIGQMHKGLGLERKELADVRYHTHKLVELGCAEEVERKEVAGKVVRFYKATERALIETEEWDALVESDPALADHLLGEFMQAQIDHFTDAVKAGTIGKDGEFHVTYTHLPLDEEGVQEGLEAYERLRFQMAEIQRRSSERRASGSPVIHVASCLSFFKIPPPLPGAARADNG
jgi:hypothetical protein